MFYWVNYMKQILSKTKRNIINQKKKYLFLTIITVIGIISGILFIFFISKEDKSLVKNELSHFITYIQSNKINYIATFMNSILTNLTYLIVFWLLGISIIGIPIIIFLLFLRGFILGFSFSSIISIYGIRGIPLSIASQIPHSFVFLIIFLLIGFYAINFSVRLFQVLFLRENINLTPYFKRYNQIMFISIIGILICCLLETFLSPIFMNLFL